MYNDLLWQWMKAEREVCGTGYIHYKQLLKLYLQLFPQNNIHYTFKCSVQIIQVDLMIFMPLGLQC